MSGTPSIKICAGFQTHKPKETPADCADAWWASEDCRRVAVSDGVTRSLYPGGFAEDIVYWFCEKDSAIIPDCEAWLAPVRERWLEAAGKRVAKLGRRRDPAFINNRERLQSRVPGAATFAGVEFSPGQGTAKITIVGDSCLFIFADGSLAEALPYGSSAEFDNQPKAFLSHAGQGAVEPLFREQPMLPPDAMGAHYVLATDALAKWIFEKLEGGEDVLPMLLALKTEKDFLAFVDTERERDNRALNDDITLVIVSVGEPSVGASPIARTVPVECAVMAAPTAATPPRIAAPPFVNIGGISSAKSPSSPAAAAPKTAKTPSPLATAIARKRFWMAATFMFAAYNLMLSIFYYDVMRDGIKTWLAVMFWLCTSVVYLTPAYVAVFEFLHGAPQKPLGNKRGDE